MARLRFVPPTCPFPFEKNHGVSHPTDSDSGQLASFCAIPDAFVGGTRSSPDPRTSRSRDRVRSNKYESGSLQFGPFRMVHNCKAVRAPGCSLACCHAVFFPAQTRAMAMPFPTLLYMYTIYLFESTRVISPMPTPVHAPLHPAHAPRLSASIPSEASPFCTVFHAARPALPSNNARRPISYTCQITVSLVHPSSAYLRFVVSN
jgi:hypothetical protein